MATIKKTENGTWTLRYRDPTGRQIRRSFKKHAEAQAIRAQVESDMLTGTYIDPTASKTSAASGNVCAFGDLA